MATDQETTLRDDLDAAFEQHSEATDEPPAAPATAAPGEPAAPVEQAAAAQRARDERGRFAAAAAAASAPAAQQAPAVASTAGQVAPQPTTAPAAPGAELKAPGSWRPEVREKWQTVDPTVRAEVHRREVEFQTMLQQTAQQRQFQQAFERTVAPYEVFIRDENATPLQAVANLMQAAATLRIGSPMNKAQLVHSMIRQYGVDLPMLDGMLAQSGGVQGATVPHQQAPMQDPRVDQLLAQQRQAVQYYEQMQTTEIRGTLDSFGSTHEFYRDVAGVMADIVEMRERQGLPPDSLESVYNKACQMHDGVSTILSQRAVAARANGNSQAVLRAKRAAASVKGDSTPDDGASIPKNDSVRAALEAAFESHANR